MPVKLCSATTAEGTACRAVALANRSFCRAHQLRRHRSSRQRQAVRAPSIRLSSLHSHDAILNNLTRIAQALASGTLNLDRAAAHLNTIHQATQALLAAEGSSSVAFIGPESWNPDSPGWLDSICFPPHE